MRPKVMVTGTGRCGTLAFSLMLNHAEIPAGHERFWGPSQELPVWPVDVSAMAAPHAASFDGAVVRLVRHPLDVVASLLRIGMFADPTHPWRQSPNGRTIDQHFRFDDTNPLLTAVRYVLEWNAMIPDDAYTVRIEHVAPDDVEWVGDRAGVAAVDAEWAVRRVPADTNSHGPTVRVGWEDVDPALRRFAAAYGYR